MLLALLLAAGPVRYLALGDSFTAGTGAKLGEDFPALIVKEWQRKGHDVSHLNLAVNGYTSQLLISRELPQAVKFAPTHVTVLIGANDMVKKAVLDTYRAQIRRILERLIEAGVAPANICVLPQPDWPLSPQGATMTEEKTVVAWNDAARAIAKEHGACFLDLWPLMQKQAKKKMWSEDGLHPNADAYREWAQYVVDNNPWGLR